MERIRILAAAAALSEFTVAELCAYSGANEHTVRSVLSRDAELIEPLDSLERTGAGRPRRRYRVKDLETIRSELRTLEESIEALGSRRRGESEPQSTEDRLAAALVAEDALLRAMKADVTDEESWTLAETARESALQAMSAEEDAPVRDEIDARGRVIAVLAQAVVRKTGAPGGAGSKASKSPSTVDSRPATAFAPDLACSLLAVFSASAAPLRRRKRPAIVEPPAGATYTSDEVVRSAELIRDRHQVMAIG